MEFIADIGKIIVFLLCLLSIFLFTSKTKRKGPNLLFAFFLLLTAFDVSSLFLHEIYFEYTYLNHFKVASVLLQMPLFYFYVSATCYHNFKLKSIHLIHSLLFTGFFILFFLTRLSEQSYFAFGIVAQLQYYAYIIAIFYTLRKYKQLNLENYAQSDQTYKWLMQTTILFLIGNSFVLIRSLYTNTQNDSILFVLNLGTSLFALIVICWFVLKTMYSPELFLGIDKNLKPIKESAVENIGKYTEELAYLSNYMDQKTPYLDDSLSLQGLAIQMDISEKHLSFLINRIMGKHFFDYINNYRIEEAKSLLKTQSNLTVLEIMYRVGFNSKSSFYTAFKKNTKQTPTEYRKTA